MIGFVLQTKLRRWLELGLISANQAEAILQHEEGRDQHRMKTAFSLLAAFTIVLGCISLIAANWDSIPSTLKLAADYLIFAGLAFLCFRSEPRPNSPWIFDGLLLAYALWILATIGLNAQIFHLSGPWYQTGLFWGLLMLIPTMASRKSLLPLTLVGVLLISSLEFGQSSPLMNGFFRNSLSALTLLLVSSLVIVERGLSTQSPQSPMAQAVRTWVFIGTLGGLLIGDYARQDNSTTALRVYVPAWIALATTLAALMTDPRWNRLQKYGLTATFLLLSVILHGELLPQPERILTTVLALMTLLSGALTMAIFQHWRLFHFMMVLLGLRLLLFYFEVFGGLAYTGTGLIVSGLLILAGLKLEPRFAAWAKEKLS